MSRSRPQSMRSIESMTSIEYMCSIESMRSVEPIGSVVWSHLHRVAFGRGQDI
jgi:hypothetical protein